MPSDESVDLLRIVELVASSGADVVVIGGVSLSLLGGSHITVDADFAFSRRKETI